MPNDEWLNTALLLHGAPVPFAFFPAGGEELHKAIGSNALCPHDAAGFIEVADIPPAETLKWRYGCRPKLRAISRFER